MFPEMLLGILYFVTVLHSNLAKEQATLCICIKSSDKLSYGQNDHRLVSSKCYDAQAYISHILTERIQPNKGFLEVTMKLGTCAERNRRFISDSFGGSIDAGAKNDGSSSYGGSVHTPVGSVSGHVHVNSNGHVSGGDGSVSGHVGGVGTAGVHGSYEHGHWSAGVDAGVHLGSIADASAHVDVNDHHQVSGGINAGVDLGGVHASESVDVDHHGHITEGGQITVGRRHQDRRFISDSFGGSIDAGAKNDGSSSYGGSVHTPAGSVSGHVHMDSHGHVSGGDGSVSGNVGGVGTAGAHGSYDHGHWSAGVDAGVHLGSIADASAHVDVNDHHQVSGGINAGVDLGGVKASESVDVDHNGHITEGGQITVGRREQDRRFISDSFGGSIDAGAKNDGSSNYGGSVHTPVGSVSGHVHMDSHGHVSGGDGSVSGNVGGLGTAGVHGSYDHGHWSAGVDAGVHLGSIADASAHVDVNDHHQVSGGINAGVDLGGVHASESVDVDHHGHITEGGQITVGRRHQDRRFISDSFGGSIDAGAKNDGSSSYGGSVHTPVGSVSGHVHMDSHGHVSGGDGSVSGNVGGVGTAGAHGSYDHGHWSAGVDAGVHLGSIADASAHVDVNDHHQVSGGINAGVDLGGVKASESVDVDHNGHITEGGQITVGRREQDRRFISDSFGGSIDAGAKNDGSSNYGGSVHTPVGSVSGHVHMDSHGHVSGGDGSVSGNVGGLGTAGVHGSYDHGHWSAGVDAGVHLGSIADASAHVDVNDHHQLSGGINAGVDLGGVKASESVDVDHNGHITEGGQITVGRREQSSRMYVK